MMTNFKKAITLFLLLLVSAVLPAQYDPSVNEFSYFEANYSFTLSSSAATFTLKMPSGSARTMIGSVAQVCSTVDTVITQELGGTASGGSAVTATSLNRSDTAVTNVLRGATASGGTQIGLAISVSANTCSPPIDITKILFAKASTSDKVYNIKSTTETSGTVSVGVVFAEHNR